MPYPSINGDPVIVRNEIRTVTHQKAVRRGGKRMVVHMEKSVNLRLYRERTDSADSDARDPDTAQYWNDPQDGAPSLISDWLVSGVSVEFDINTGLADIKITSVQQGADWDLVKVLSPEEAG